MISAALLALSLVVGAPPQATPDLPLEIVDAGEVSWDVAAQRWQIRGGAVLRRGAVTLRADSATYDASTGEVTATGGVLLSEPGRVLAGSAMRLVLDGPFEASDVVALAKESSTLDLGQCRTLEDARHAGRNRITFSGSHVAGRSGDPSISVSRPRVTLCDCGAGAPSWEVRAHGASVVPGKRAVLWLPIFYITPRFLLIDRPVPVLALPAAWIPLGNRQSGLLIPELSFARVGFALSQPLYLTLGQSWDATVTYDQVFGSREGRLQNEVDITRRTVRGIGSSLELRWAPARETAGKARLIWLHDEAQDVLQLPGGARLVGPHPDRIALTLLHDQALGPRTRLRAELGLVNDPLYVQDFTADVLLRGVEYRRSAVTLVRRGDDSVLSAEVGYHLPFVGLGQQSFAVDSAGVPRVPYGTFGSDVSVLHRLPALTATLLPVQLRGPVLASATAQVARFAPLQGPTGDEGRDGIGPGGRGGPTRDPGERDGIWEDGERLATTRALLSTQLRAPVPLGSWAILEPWAGATAAAYAFDAARDPLANGRAAGGVALFTRFSRTFGSGAGRLRHDVEPRVEWRGGSGTWGPRLPAPAWDELDSAPGGSSTAKTLTARPAGGFQQAEVALRNRLTRATGAPVALDLTLGQDLDLDRGRLAEAFLDTALQLGPVRASGEARMHPGGAPVAGVRAATPSWLDDFSLLRGSVAVADRRGDEVHANVIAMGPTGSEWLSSGLDTFFDPQPRSVLPVAQGSAGAVLKLGAATAAYEAYFNMRELAAPLCPGKSTAPHVYQHAASLGWDSPCRCFKIAVRAVLSECDPNPQIGFQVALDQLTDFRFGP
ncbi:MAG TPA: LPS-assembly protein LptD [Anaeromyxobacteraceae bacterium]|nr:LPS-assembly protein LptD [Anaeromyxobacteraceae bacterium]